MTQSDSLVLGHFGVNVGIRTVAPAFDLDVRGNGRFVGFLTKGGGSFQIDHPLDPENKYLNHSFVESPDMKNVYDGVAIFDAHGEAWIKLPEYFEALNRDFRYQLTCIGGFAPLYIAEKITNNRFKIAGGMPGMEVSWQVTGIRKDPFAEKYRLRVEEEKPKGERGYYLHPEAYGQPETKSIEWGRNGEAIKRLQEEREKLKSEGLKRRPEETYPQK